MLTELRSVTDVNAHNRRVTAVLNKGPSDDMFKLWTLQRWVLKCNMTSRGGD